MLSAIDSMSLSMTAPSSGIKIHTKKWYQQMALILLCEEVIESTASAVTCVKNDRICDIIFQLYPSARCQIIHLTKTETEPQIRIFNNPSLGFRQSEPQTGIIEMCPQVVGENSHFGRGKGKNLSWNFFSLDMTYIKDTFCKKRGRKRPFVSSELA